MTAMIVSKYLVFSRSTTGAVEREKGH